MRRAVLVIAIALAAFLGIKAIGEFMELRYIGAGISPTNVISVSGYGEAVAIPDIATFTYSVVSEKSTVAAAQDDACPGGQQKLRGYEVRQTTTVKVRDTAKAGDLLTEVGGRGATEVSGLNFTFDNPDAVEAEARDKAIADAKQKAEVLARSLGVSLVRVVSFNENGGYPSPIYYSKDAALGMGGAEEVRTAPAISVGENKVTSNVSVTYEIR